MADTRQTEPGFVRAQVSAFPDALPGSGDEPPRDGRAGTVTGLRRALVGLALAAVAVGLAGVALLVGGEPDEPAGELSAVLTLVIGWGLALGGVFAWSRQPANRFGPLLALSGFAWLTVTLQAAGTPLLSSAGTLAGGLWTAAVVHALVAFPDGRLGGAFSRALVIAGWLAGSVLYVLPVLFVDRVPDCGGCPPPLFTITSRPALADAFGEAYAVAAAAVVLAGAARLIGRRRSASTPQRRALGPLPLVGAVALVLVAAARLTDLAPPLTGLDWSPVDWVAHAALAAVPVAFLAGLAGGSFTRASAVAQLVERLSDSLPPEGVRQALAQALGDRTVELAFWLPESERYVDGSGRSTSLPQEGDGRVWTEIDRAGHRVAAIVHDASLCSQPDLVRRAGAAVGLALENERLEAALKARVAELRDSRARMVRAADAERRRLERNLHDGAQQRLVALSVRLRLATSKVGSDSEQARRMLEECVEETQTTIADLRELARGIHPAVLSDRGLGPALAALATRAPVPVELEAHGSERLEPGVEAGAYFVVAEALTNVAKYAQASHARVTVRRGDGRLWVEVRDDGVGGADPSAGSGLRGLWDRVGALDGRIEVISPAGEGTVVRAEIPCATEGGG